MEEIKRCGPFQCSICEDTLHNPTMLLECLHVFCHECIQEVIAQKSNPTCPSCSEEITALNRFVRIHPKLSDPTQSINNEDSLQQASQEFTSRVAAHDKLKDMYEEKDEESQSEFDDLKEDFASVRKLVEPEIKELKMYRKKFEKAQAKLTRETAIQFNKIHKEIASNSQRPGELDKMVPFDEVKSAWLSARSEYEEQREIENEIEETNQQTTEISNHNDASRMLIDHMGPEELSQRLDRSLFEELCGVMGWDHEQYASKDSDDDEILPSANQSLKLKPKEALPEIFSVLSDDDDPTNYL